MGGSTTNSLGFPRESPASSQCIMHRLARTLRNGNVWQSTVGRCISKHVIGFCRDVPVIVGTRIGHWFERENWRSTFLKINMESQYPNGFTEIIFGWWCSVFPILVDSIEVPSQRLCISTQKPKQLDKSPQQSCAPPKTTPLVGACALWYFVFHRICTDFHRKKIYLYSKGPPPTAISRLVSSFHGDFLTCFLQLGGKYLASSKYLGFRSVRRRPLKKPTR